MCRLSWNLGASTPWNPQGLSRPVMGLLYVYLIIPFSQTQWPRRLRRVWGLSFTRIAGSNTPGYMIIQDEFHRVWCVCECKCGAWIIRRPWPTWGCCTMKKRRRIPYYTGLFISPSGISDPCGTVAGMVTPKGNMSTEGETRQVPVLPYRCSICWFLRAPAKRFSHTLDSLGRWLRPASSFRSAQAATLLEFHVLLTNCFVRRWFCAVHGPEPPLHRHNWLSFGKFQDTERFLIYCARHFSSRLPHSGGTCKYAKAPSTKKTLRVSLPIDMLLSAVSFLVVAQSSSEVPEWLMNNPVLFI